jgi:hypothetical protein
MGCLWSEVYSSDREAGTPCVLIFYAMLVTTRTNENNTDADEWKGTKEEKAGLFCVWSLSCHFQFHQDKNTETANPKSTRLQQGSSCRHWPKNKKYERGGQTFLGKP